MAGVRRITDDEVRAALDTANIVDRAMLLIGLNFGTRISETLSLTFGDLAGSEVEIRAKKKGLIQRYPIPEQVRGVIAELRKYYHDKGVVVTGATPLFVSKSGRPVSRQAASQRMKRIFKRAGIEGRVNSHSLRKAFVTAIYEATGKDIAKTRLYSRHKSLANLQYYIDSGEATDLVEKLHWG